MKARELDNLLCEVSPEAKVYIRTSQHEIHEICAVELYRRNGVDAVCFNYNRPKDEDHQEENDRIAAAITFLQSKGIKIEE